MLPLATSSRPFVTAWPQPTLARAEDAKPTTTADEWQAVIIIMIETLRAAMTHEQWMEYTTRLSKDPRLKAILAMEQARQTGGAA